MLAGKLAGLHGLLCLTGTMVCPPCVAALALTHRSKMIPLVSGRSPLHLPADFLHGDKPECYGLWHCTYLVIEGAALRAVCSLMLVFGLWRMLHQPTALL